MPTRDHTIAEQSKNYRYSTNHQMVIDADTRLAAAGRPLPGNRNDCRACSESGTEAAADETTTITDNSHDGTRPATPHHRRTGEELLDWQQAHNKSRKQVRARVEHAFARMKTCSSSATAAFAATESVTRCPASPACIISTSPDRRPA